MKIKMFLLALALSMLISACGTVGEKAPEYSVSCDGDFHIRRAQVFAISSGYFRATDLSTGTEYIILRPCVITKLRGE